MNDKEILIAANDAVLERPFEFTVTINPKNRFHRLLMKLRIKPKKITLIVRPTVLGARVWYSKSLGEVNVGLDDLSKTIDELNHEITLKYTNSLVKAIASLIHNQDSEPPKRLISLLVGSLSSKELFYLLKKLRVFVQSEDFLNSIILGKGMSLNEREELIAPDTLTSGR